MITIEQSQAMARTRSRKSAQEGERPFSPWPEDFDNLEYLCQSIPHLGARRRIQAAYGEGYWRIDSVQRFIPAYPYRWWFLDSSGLGRGDEAALTPNQFLSAVKAYRQAAIAAGYSLGLGIVVVGQFQVHVAPYLLKVR